MTDEALADLFEKPVESRYRIMGAVRHNVVPLPGRGSSFFIHLSELCPVACEHCMYASDLNAKSAKTSLSKPELEQVIGFINESHSEKLNITGGGEPFLKFESILRLLETVVVPRVEIVTAGHWGKSEQRARQLLTRLDEALRRNPSAPETMLRLSIDRYHIEAPRPVRVEHYGNVVRAWEAVSPSIALGFRSIQPDMGLVDTRLAQDVGGRVVEVDDWNRRIVLRNGRSLPITFNVFRFSGKATELRDDLLVETQTIKQYYRPFESGGDRLTLATAVNDAIRGSYRASDGIAVTLNSDGSFWIFCGTAPDRRLPFRGQSFAEAVAYFFDDPITHLLVRDGVWRLADTVARLDSPTSATALAKNDVACLVEELLAPDDVRLATTIIAAAEMVADGRAVVDDDPDVARIVEAPVDLTRSCADAIAARRK
ncbi:MAG TPA: 4Fe-4S cluster-binding domain-containing protein [Actinomycetota bacterium]|nr:4Fe-4S cluster-binding domain-containing protein [Actinomycetota bacterium]